MWTKPEFQRMAQRLHQYMGLTFPENRHRSSECHMLAAMRESGFEDLTTFENAIGHDKVIFQRFINSMVVGETYFQRESTRLDFLASTIVPRLRDERTSLHKLKIWCAGCSTGEEAYTLAAQLSEAGLKNRFQIIATDISTRALAHAARGQYSKWSFRAVEESFVKRHFGPFNDGWIVNEQLRENVVFKQVNLLDARLDENPDLAGSDIIFCRNVLIYFDRMTVDKLAGQFFNCLSDGGWLVSGVSDPSLAAAPFEVQMHDRGTFYRKSKSSKGSFGTLDLGTREERQVVVNRGERGDTLVASEICAPKVMPSTDSQTETATVLFEKGEWQSIVDLFKHCAAEEPCLALVVRSLANLGKQEAAQSQLANALERFPLSTELWFLQSMLSVEQRQFTNAVDALKKVIYLDRSIAAAHFTLAVIQQLLKEERSALKSYENVLTICSQVSPDQKMYLGNGQTAQTMLMLATKQMKQLAVRGMN